MQATVEYQLLTCPQCQIALAISTAVIDSIHSTRGTLYCPNGHPFTITKPLDPASIQALRARLATVEQQLRTAREECTAAKSKCVELRHRVEQAEAAGLELARKLAAARAKVRPSRKARPTATVETAALLDVSQGKGGRR